MDNKREVLSGYRNTSKSIVLKEFPYNRIAAFSQSMMTGNGKLGSKNVPIEVLSAIDGTIIVVIGDDKKFPRREYVVEAKEVMNAAFDFYSEIGKDTPRYDVKTD